MAGTFASAVKNAASESAASALMPARSNSLFFAGRVSLLARCLRSSSTRYSAFGIVKLSRTSFGFLVFSSFSALIKVSLLLLTLVFASTGLVATCLGSARVAAGLEGVFTTDFIGGLASDLAAGLTPDLTSFLAGTWMPIAFLTAGLAALAFLPAGTAAIALVLAGPVPIALVFAVDGSALAGLFGNGFLAAFMNFYLRK